MLNKFYLILILGISSPLALSQGVSEKLNLNNLQKLENTVLSCSQVSDNIKDPLILNCYANGHNIIKQKINSQIKSLTNKDKISLLNTKGLDFEIIRFSCKKSYSDTLSIKECEVYTDLAYLDYIISRYYQ